jgi:hypothetical protein
MVILSPDNITSLKNTDTWFHLLLVFIADFTSPTGLLAMTPISKFNKHTALQSVEAVIQAVRLRPSVTEVIVCNRECSLFEQILPSSMQCTHKKLLTK